MTETLQSEMRGDREIVMTRTFAAPRALVWDCLTKPDLLRRWYGPQGWTLVTCTIDLRAGGAYRYVMRKEGSAAREMGWGGVFRDVDAPERTVCTEVFDEAWYEGECLITTTLAEERGRTQFTAVMRYASTAARDAVFADPHALSGLEPVYQRLARLLAERAAA